MEHTQYIGSMKADLNDQSREATVEIRVDGSESFDGLMALGFHSFKTGKEFVTGHLTEAQAIELKAAIDLWLVER